MGKNSYIPYTWTLFYGIDGKIVEPEIKQNIYQNKKAYAHIILCIIICCISITI